MVFIVLLIFLLYPFDWLYRIWIVTYRTFMTRTGQTNEKMTYWSQKQSNNHKDFDLRPESSLYWADGKRAHTRAQNSF